MAVGGVVTAYALGLGPETAEEPRWRRTGQRRVPAKSSRYADRETMLKVRAR